MLLEGVVSCFAITGLHCFRVHKVRREALAASQSLLERRKELFLGVLSELAAE